ncbi:MAG: SH3 domain-containing protein [Oscillospiraceae bacterium]|nr:SH3 domain-containing protein [Oscillospiraceae bacterium]
MNANRKQLLRRLVGFSLVICLIVTVLPMVVFASSSEKEALGNNEKYPLLPDRERIRIPGGQALTNAYLERQERGADEANATSSGLPSRYDGREKGYLTAVRNQSPYGTCWAHATIAAVETSMVKNGVINKETGKPATTSLNLSESHLAWFTRTYAYDKLGLLSGDYVSATANNYLNTGGWPEEACYTLMRWEGPASETNSALAYWNVSPYGLDASYAYNYDVAHITDSIWIPTANRDAVKEGIMKYGAAVVCYYHDFNLDCYNAYTAAYCLKNSPHGDNINHAVAIVGWDDNYPKSNFASAYGPSMNGAWIVKNSWGAGWGDRGYFYLSYEDTAALNDTCYFYQIAPVDNYSNCYQYDGSSYPYHYSHLKSGSQVANVYTAKATENLTAVAINTADEAISYTLRIYKNPGSTPTSGTFLTGQTGYIDYPGYYTIPLHDPVPLKKGDRFAVVFTLNTLDGSNLSVPYDATSFTYYCDYFHADRGDTSFFREVDEDTWDDVPQDGDYRIKAYTSPSGPRTYTITANLCLNMREGPSASGKILAKVPNGALVKVTEVENDWGKITYDGKTGWVNLYYCRYDGALNRYYTIAAYSALKMRDNPSSTGTKVLTSIPQGKIVKVTYFRNGWGKTTYNGQTGWINLSYCSYKSVIDRNYIVTCGGKTLAFRADHSSSTTILDRIPDGTLLHIDYFFDSWGRTTYNGKTGWVNLFYCTFNGAIDKDYTIYVNGTGLSVREKHDATSEVLTTIPNGKKVHVKYFYNGWGKTTYNGKTGWIYLLCLK